MIRKVVLNSRHFSNVSKPTRCNESILRQLGPTEQLLNKLSSKGLNQIVYTIAIESKIDLYANVDLLRSSILVWKRQHPFLDCTILNEDQNIYFVKVKNAEFLNNVEFLNFTPFYRLQPDIRAEFALYRKLKNLPEVDDYAVWSKLHDVFIHNPISTSINEYLWKLLFIKLDHKHYCTVFTSYHEIAGGWSFHSLMRQLLKIIHAKYNDEPLTSDFHLMHQVPKPLETYYTNVNQVVEKHAFIVPESAMQKELQSISLDGVLCNYKNNSEFYPSETTIKKQTVKFKLNKKMSKNFFEICNSNESKPASVFAVIVSVALQKAFKEIDASQSEIFYALSVNLNQFLKDKIHADAMGYYDTEFINKIHSESIDKALKDGKLVNNAALWELSKIETGKNLEKRQKILLESKKQPVHFRLTNLGAVQSFPETIGSFKILDFQSGTTTSKFDMNLQLFTVYLYNTADELHVSFEVYTKPDFTKCFIDFIKETVYKIVE